MTYPNQPHPQPHPYSALQTIATPVVYALLVIAGGFGAFFSLFAGMATAACSGIREQCDFDLFGQAYYVWWGGTGIALLLPAIGIGYAQRAGTSTLRWPLVGFAILIGSVALAFAMMDAALPSSV